MPLELQMRLNTNELYKKYLRSHSHWYKKLIRDPGLFKELHDEMRINYKLRPIDKISKTMDIFTMISNIFNNMI